MASSQLYGASELFLVGDTGDVLVTVNSEQATTLLQAGTVYVSRDKDALGSREASGTSVHLYPRVELRPVAPPVDREVGLGWAERDSAWDFVILARRDALNLGKTQLDTLARIAESIRHRYARVSNLAISERGSLGKTTLWTLAGVSVGTNTDATGLLYVHVEDETPVAGQARVSLYKATGGVAGTLVAQGSAADGATVTLAAQNASGLSGTVKLGTVTASETNDTHYLNVALQKSTPATFVRCNAAVTRVDDTPDSETEMARAVVRVVFTFLEPEADNT